MTSQHIGLGIRWGLFVAFGVICALGVVAAVAAGYALQRVNTSLELIVSNRVPTAVTALNIARKAEVLVASARLLAVPISEEDTDRKWHEIQSRLETVTANFDKSLAGQGLLYGQTLKQLLGRLTTNLQQIDAVTHERLRNAAHEAEAMHNRLTNLQSFQQELQPRLRVLEAQASQMAGIRYQQADLSLINNLRDIANLVPAARMSIDIQTINNKLLLSANIKNATDLAISAARINRILTRLDLTTPALDATLDTTLQGKLIELHNIVDGPSGIITLHNYGLKLVKRSNQLLTENENITNKFSIDLQAMVERYRNAIHIASENALTIERHGILILAVAIIVSIMTAILIMVFYVDRHILAHLDQIRNGMLAVAAGEYDIPLPPVGSDELGRLGSALAKFRSTAMEAERIALSDPLTSIGNRRHLSERAVTAIAFARRYHSPLSAAIFDIDHFKHVNDNWGHAVGDVVLQRVAELASEKLRTSDFLARLGGEEFVLLLPETILAGAEQIAERIRAAIAATMIEVEDATVSVTVSFGVAVLGPDEKTLESMLARADKALYRAKREGRNRIVCALT